MADLRNTMVNGDLTVTGKVNFFDETVAPSTQSEIVQATNMVISDKFKNLTGNDIYIETSSNGSIYHKKGETAYKLYDTSDFTVDSELKSSNNPVQNKVIKSKIDSIDNNITSMTTSIVSIKDVQIPNIENEISNINFEVIPTLQSTLENKINETLKKVYPVGSIYLSVVSTNPGILFGFGEWTQIKDTFLLCAGDTYAAGSTGGEESHILTEEEVGPHTHSFSGTALTGSASSFMMKNRTASGVFSTTDVGNNRETTSGVDWARLNFKADLEGIISQNRTSATAHNNMPPYLSVYVWQRKS